MLGIAIITSVVIVAVIIAYFAVTAEAVNEDSTTLSFQLVHIWLNDCWWYFSLILLVEVQLLQY